MKKLFVLMCCSAWVGQAQNIHVKPISGVQNSYAVADISKISFSNGQMVLALTSNGNASFPLSAIRHLRFSDFPLNNTEQVSDKASYILYPNPVGQVLHLTQPPSDATGYYLHIYAMDGRLLHSQYYGGGEAIAMDVDFLSAGVYICQIKSGQKSQSISFIKQ